MEGGGGSWKKRVFWERHLASLWALEALFGGWLRLSKPVVEDNLSAQRRRRKGKRGRRGKDLYVKEFAKVSPPHKEDAPEFPTEKDCCGLEVSPATLSLLPPSFRKEIFAHFAALNLLPPSFSSLSPSPTVTSGLKSHVFPFSLRVKLLE